MKGFIGDTVSIVLGVTFMVTVLGYTWGDWHTWAGGFLLTFVSTASQAGLKR